MDQGRFDALTRTLAQQGTRRALVRRVAGVAVGGLAAVGLGPVGRFNRALKAADSEEQSVMLYEELARIAHEHVGTCAELRLKHGAFFDLHGDMLASHKTEQDAWTREKRIEHAETYGDRRHTASALLLAATRQCRHAVMTPKSLGSAATPEAGDSVATPAAALQGFQRLMAVQATPVVDDRTPDAGGQQAVGDASQCPSTVSVLCYIGARETVTEARTVPATCGESGCTPCVPDDWCATTFPDDCGSGQICTVELSGASPQCAETTDMVCVWWDQSAQRITNYSPVFSIYAYQDSSGAWQSCEQADYCTTYYPDVCPSADTCFLVQHVVPDEDCCNDECPLSTADCALNWAGVATADYECLGCKTSWCGSTSRCMSNCESEGCCDAACNQQSFPAESPVEGGL